MTGVPVRTRRFARLLSPVLWGAGALIGLSASPATAQTQTRTAGAGTCPATPARCSTSIVREYETPLHSRLEELAAAGPYADPSGTAIGPTTVLGLELIRDMFIRQMEATADLFGELAGKGSYDKRTRLGTLHDRARELLELRLEAARAEERLRAAIANYEAPIGSLERETLGALEREATANYERTLEATAAELPELMIRKDGRALYETLGGMEGGAVGSSERMSMLTVYDSFLSHGRDDLRRGAKEAAAHTTIDELWRYGDPAFGLLQQLVAVQGGLVGSNLPSLLMGDVQNHWRSERTLSDAETAHLQIGLAVVGILLAPVSVAGCAVMGVADVVISGGELYVAVEHERDVTELAPVVGERTVLDAEKKAERAAIGLVLSTAGAALDVGVLGKLGVRAVDEGLEAATVARAERAAAGNTGEAATRAATHAAGGHGEMVDGFFVLADNVTVRFHTPAGTGIIDDAAREIEEAAFRGAEPPATTGTRRTYEGGDRVPEHVLYPADDGPMVFVYMPWSDTTVTVTSPRQLSRIVQELSERFPDQQIVLDWAACRDIARRARLDVVPVPVRRAMAADAAPAATSEAAGIGERPEPVDSPPDPTAPDGESKPTAGPTGSATDGSEGAEGEAETKVAIGTPAQAAVPPIEARLVPGDDPPEEAEEEPRGGLDQAAAFLFGNLGEIPAEAVNPPGTGNADRDPRAQLVILDGPHEAVEAEPAGSPRPAPGGHVVIGPDGELRVLVESLGGVGEGAMELTVFNGTDLPVRLTGEGLVVEPVELEEEAKRRIVEELRDLAGKNPVTARIDAYCLELLREPPTVGTVFRIASQDLQQRFAPLRDVLSASRRLQEAGLLNPDSDPTEYFHSIRQWALWTVEENLDAEGFGRAFLEQIRSNFEEAGQPWTEEARDLVEGLVPNRWKDVRQVVEKAREMTDANREESP